MTSHEAVSAAKRSELAGVASVREAGIPPSSERDQKLRSQAGHAGQAVPAATEAPDRVFDAGCVTGDEAAGELSSGASDARDVVVGQVEMRALRDPLHGRRGRERGGCRVVQTVRAPQRLFDDEHRARGGDLIGGRGGRVNEVGRDEAKLIDAQPLERPSELHEVHLTYVGTR